MDGGFREGVESKIKYRNLMYSIDIQSPEFMKYLERGEREAFQQLFETYHKALCFFAARSLWLKVVRIADYCTGCFSFLLENGPGWFS